MSNNKEASESSTAAAAAAATAVDATVAPKGSDVVPQLETANGDSGITFDELQTAVKVLKAVSALTPSKKKRKIDSDNASDDPMASYKHINLRPLRKALAQCLELHQRTMFEGRSAMDYYEDRLTERTLKRQKTAESAQQRKYIADTALRRGRIERLKEKQSEAKDEEMAKLQQRMMIPDGHVETDPTTLAIGNRNRAAPRLLTAATDETEEDSKPAAAAAATSGESEEPIQLPKLRSCYVCKCRFRELHQFYDQLCPSCAALNWEKRHQMANLQGRVAIVTGSRVKIGYQTCLKLLRAGATVVATTRFPNAAASTYRQEPDFADWQDRLHVYGLDLRDMTGIEAFCRFLKMRYAEQGIDMLINNACQTVRRPTAYYLPACQKEEELWTTSDDTHKTLLSGCLEFERVRRRLLLDHQNNSGAGGNNRIEAGTTPVRLIAHEESKPTSTLTVEEVDAESDNAMVTTVKAQATTEAPFERSGVSHSAAMSQMILLPEDAGVSDAILPPGVTDINGQQLDLRKTNSWLLKMEQVSTPEVMECMFINAIAPFVLNSRLKPLMSIPTGHEDRYIINVSAMEGKFYRYKMANHPHTNMAKAALNMMTRTSAEDLAKRHRVFMNSVDTGWINDENPLERASNTAQNNHFQTPIDEIDAAARILDPIFTGINHSDQSKDYGKFLKDYRETEW